MPMWFRVFSCLLAGALVVAGCKSASAGKSDSAATEVRFTITADIRNFAGGGNTGPDYFDGVCAAIVKAGAGQFMISPGDVDPPEDVRASLDRHMGCDYVWYPVVGNHEAETPSDMEWLRAWGGNEIPGLVRRGPKGCETTTFSFDHGPVHFVALNQYFEGKSDTASRGDVTPALYDWLKSDLEQNTRPMVLVIGHEPIAAIPDMDNGRLRHEKDSLNQNPENCRKFQELLIEKGVTAYLTAHTHNASITNLGGVWQVDAGHARGKGDPGAPSTFLAVRASASMCKVDFYRQLKPGEPYALTKSCELPRPKR
jgi:hypothetical protein